MRASRPPRRGRRSRRPWAGVALLGLAAAAVVVGVVLLLATRGPDQRETVERFARAWQRGDYAAMHDELTDAAGQRVPVAGLRKRYERADTTATATKVTVGAPIERADGVWRLPVTETTRLFGPVKGSVDVPVVEEDGKARIAWRQRLVFPGLADGEKLTRTTELPERADLVARDGTPLAEGPDRTTNLGAAAAAIVGALGPVPADRQARAAELGVPAGGQVGITGLERIFDEQLMGRPGGELRAGLRLLARRDPRKAAPVRTTIAPSVQEAAVTALAGRLGGVIAVRPKTGEVLAAAGIGFSGLQPPGSTFKIITLAGALQNRIASTKSSYPVETHATLEGVALQNANGESCGGSLATSFAHSCNSVFAPLGAKLGAAKLVKTAEAFGFNSSPGIPGAATSTIPPAAEMGDDLAVGSSAIGQGRVQATALQMATVAATIGLGGRRPQLTFDADGPDEAPTTRAISAKTARTVERLMVDVVREGTGTSAAISGVRVAGKTGTAELKSTQQTCEPDPEAAAATGTPDPCAQQQSDTTDTDAWFSSFAPAGDHTPKIAVGVLLVSAGAGGDTAAPVARQVMQAALD